MDTAFYKVLDASGIVCTGPMWLYGFYCGNMDGINDPDFTLFNGQNADGGIYNEYIPSNSLDASAKGINGAMQTAKGYFPDGCYAEIITADLTLSILQRPAG